MLVCKGCRPRRQHNKDYITDGNHELEQKLQALGIPVGETIYLFVDVVG